MLARFDSKKFLSTRKEKNLTQATVATAANTTIRYVRDMEKGKKDNPSATILYGLSAALDVPMESLMTEQEESE